MKNQNGEFAIRRILVALDSSSYSLAALEAAAKLAVRMEAELLGIFVEDINLLKIGKLPFIYRINFYSAKEEQLDSSTMEWEMKIQAEKARRKLMTMAEKMGLQWSFRTVRGDVIAEILAAALEADILSLGRVSYPLTRQVKLGSTALAATTNAPHTVLLAPKAKSFSQPILVIYDSAKTDKQAVMAATQMAKAYGCKLTILVVADCAETALKLKDELKELLKSQTIAPRYSLLDSNEILNLAKAIKEESCGALVLSSESPLVKDDVFQKLLYEMDCLLLLVK